MNTTHIANQIKSLRTKKGMSQAFLAETAGLSLRTIQRIENSETSPTGDSINRLANALGVTPDDLMDWSLKEDNSYLVYLSLSAFSFLIFPLLGILLPFMLWTSKRGKIKDIDDLGKAIVNFQITWNIFLFLIPSLLLVVGASGLVFRVSLSLVFLSIIVLYAINLICTIINTIRIQNGKHPYRFKAIRFLR